MRPEPEVHSITGAATPHSDDLDLRIRRYLISMGIRTVCVVLALVVHNWPLRWVFIVGAVGLPYVAVVMANVGSGKKRTAVPKVSAQPLTGLGTGEPTSRTMPGETVNVTDVTGPEPIDLTPGAGTRQNGRAAPNRTAPNRPGQTVPGETIERETSSERPNSSSGERTA